MSNSTPLMQHFNSKQFDLIQLEPNLEEESESVLFSKELMSNRDDDDLSDQDQDLTDMVSSSSSSSATQINQSRAYSSNEVCFASCSFCQSFYSKLDSNNNNTNDTKSFYFVDLDGKVISDRGSINNDDRYSSPESSNLQEYFRKRLERIRISK